MCDVSPNAIVEVVRIAVAALKASQFSFRLPIACDSVWDTGVRYGWKSDGAMYGIFRLKPQNPQNSEVTLSALRPIRFLGAPQLSMQFHSSTLITEMTMATDCSLAICE